MRKHVAAAVAALVTGTLVVFAAGDARASSHREAPFITKNPKVGVAFAETDAEAVGPGVWRHWPLCGLVWHTVTVIAEFPNHPLAHQVAGEQKDAEAEHDGCRCNFGAAHQHRPIAGPLAGKPLGKRFRTDRHRCNRADGDGGANPHNDGRGDARPKHPLR